MNHRCRILQAVLVIVVLLTVRTVGFCQETPPQPTYIYQPVSIYQSVTDPGDRVYSTESAQPVELHATTLAKDEYKLGPGDILAINVQGRSVTNYLLKPETTTVGDHNLVTVSPSGGIYLPLVGTLSVRGKTVAQVETEVSAGLAKYFRHFTVDVALSTPRSVYALVTGEVKFPGMVQLPGTATVSYLAAKSAIQPTGTTRRLELIRDEKKQIIDLYSMLVLGNPDLDVTLAPGDKLYVPPVSRYVEANGQLTRTGRFEMVTALGSSGDFRVRDLLDLTVGMTPTAASSKATIERIGQDGQKIAISIDLSGNADSVGMNLKMQSGDVLVVPSISAYQPIVRMIGEFKGDGVYQRVLAGEQVQNKSGIYYLKQGQTVGDVITATGGVTPQADMAHAHISRLENGKTTSLPVDLDRLLVKGDKSADVVLHNGDTFVLPALADKVHVFGDVKNPGAFDYGPSRRLADYIGDAGGPTGTSKLSQIQIVRGSVDKPIMMRVNLKAAIMGKSVGNNPVLEAGDIVYVPSKFVGGWRDGIQLIFTALSLSSLLKNF